MTEHCSILIVDDDEVFAEVLSESFSNAGYSNRVAHSHHQALQACENTHFEKAIVDLKLGTDSGLQLIPDLLKLQPEMKIVMLTAFSSIATAVEAVKLGAMDYICKPASSQDILNAFDESRDQAEIPEQPHSIDRLEWEHIQRVLNENSGNISATARALGMHRRTLQRKLQKKPVEH